MGKPRIREEDLLHLPTSLAAAGRPARIAIEGTPMKMTPCWLDIATPFASGAWRDFDWLAISGCFGKPWFLPIVRADYHYRDLVA